MAVLTTPAGYAAHKALILKFLTYLNSRTSNFVLKGGTALMVCYSLSRFSEDIDLDAVNRSKDVLPIIKQFCADNNLYCRVAKDTNTVKRCIVHYSVPDGSEHYDATLKIEVSYRGADSRITCVSDMTVYTIECLFKLKMNALLGRDALRDIFDVLFIYKNYAASFQPSLIQDFKQVLIAKGSDAIIETIATQSDALINNSVLEDMYIQVCESLGVII